MCIFITLLQNDIIFLAQSTQVYFILFNSATLRIYDTVKRQKYRLTICICINAISRHIKKITREITL